MEQLTHVTQTIALTMGTAWASGLNLYATILVLGLMGNSGNMVLPESLHIVQEPLVIGAAALMYAVEFFADKFPGVDTGWDAIHTFIRIPAGAALAAAATGQTDPAISLAAAIVGGSLTAATHATKAGTRAVVNTSPEPFSNWALSIGEDVAVIGGLWTALNHPVLFLCALALFIVLLIWLLPKLWRGIKRIFATLGRWLGLGKQAPAQADLPGGPPPAPDINAAQANQTKGDES
ncbi:MAG: DUF4126 domain-containing protein [Desulfuromonadaceae bacterium]|nr:DUF4126 domain-containing protein [Desulfuromonadaceae bacterium]